MNFLRFQDIQADFLQNQPVLILLKMVGHLRIL